MTDRPTIYLNSWAWVAARRRDGTWPLDRSGRAYTIQARPRGWEWGDGVVDALVPPYQILGRYRRGTLSLAGYRSIYEAGVKASMALIRGGLRWRRGDLDGLVTDGDTLCCSCSAARSMAGECHRAWAAPYLVQAGWRVVLDGQEVTP